MLSRIVCRCFYTNFAIQARPRWTNRDPGINKRMQILDSDDPYKQEVEDEEDLSSLEPEIQNIDLMHLEHKRELYKKRQYIGQKITEKKFFAEPKQPTMLTWAERLQIKQLHEKDPEEWTLDVLAESFPATRATISKILNQQWKPENLEKMKRKDEIVHENWKLLAEGKLDADPELIKHWQKFLPRRQEFLATLQNNEDVTAFLEKPEPKKIWNNGQMSRILESYDNSLKILNEKEKMKQKMLESKDVLEEQIKFEIEQNSDRESFKIGDASAPSRHTTLPELKKQLKGRQNRQLDLFEEVIVEKEKTQTNRLPINERLARLAGYSLNVGGKVEDVKRIGKSDKPDKRSSTEDDESIKKLSGITKEGVDGDAKTEIIGSSKTLMGEGGIMALEDWKTTSEGKYNVEESRREENRIKKENIDESEVSIKDSQSNYRNFEGAMNNSEESEKFGGYNSAREIDQSSYRNSHATMTESEQSEKISGREIVDENKSQEASNHEEIGKEDVSTEKSQKLALENVSSGEQVETVTKTYEFSSEQDKQEFELEEKRISQTFFWNDGNKVVEPEVTKVDLGVMKLKQGTVNCDVEYAEKIKVPKDKRGSGLTFRVKDCYYDDDGQFLYRVPGMTTVASEEK